MDKLRGTVPLEIEKHLITRTMKRIAIIAVALFSFAVSLSAQQAFQNLSIGFEAGTTGLGVELAVPVISNHVVLKGGLTLPSLSLSKDFSLDASPLNSSIDDANQALMDAGVDDRINTRFTSIGVKGDALLNFSAARVLLEYYPFKKSGIHITAGAYFGMGDSFLSANVATTDDFYSEFKAVESEVDAINQKYADLSGYEPVTLGSPKFNLDGKTYQLAMEEDRAFISARLQMSKIRPYLGIGFGRSIPKGHLGFQFDLGVWYHGVPSIESDQQVEYDASATEVYGTIPYMHQAVIYPHLSLRLIYRIF